MKNPDAPRILIFEEKHMIATLLYLAENDGCKKTDLYGDVSYNQRMPDKLNLLESAGLIRQEKVDGSRTIKIYLTDEGQSVAQGLQTIEEKMQTI